MHIPASEADIPAHYDHQRITPEGSASRAEKLARLVLDFGNTRNRANFHMLVRTVILKAAYVAATAVGANVPRRLQIAIIGSQRDGTYVDIADVTDVLFREDGLVARRIDVSVGNIRGDFADVLVVVAEPQPCRFEESYNVPKGYGPFRVVHWLAADRMTGT